MYCNPSRCLWVSCSAFHSSYIIMTVFKSSKLALGSLAVVSFLQPVLSQGPTYYLDQSCRNRAGFSDIFPEVITAAQQIWDDIPGGATASQHPQLNGWLQLFFGTGFGDLENPNAPYDSNTNKYWTDYIKTVYGRMKDMQEITTVRNADIRIYCDGQSRYQAVDQQGNPITSPTPGTLAFNQTLFYDSVNDAASPGEALNCLRNSQRPIGGPFASANYNIGQNFEILRRNRWAASTQNSQRVTINFCESTFMYAAAGGRPGPPLYSWRSWLASGKVGRFRELAIISPMAPQVLVHELTHTPQIGQLTFGSTGRNYRVCLDAHVPNAANPNNVIWGYYQKGNPRTLGERVRTPYTIGNADSYGYTLMLYRMRQDRYDYSRPNNAGPLLIRRVP
ncbi:unnamed protein product [Periconia digitata]|uniref:Uncharacterized protein n=1 Tax=Periconia digitata TaxID=1303443 RepID=A0A9W4XMJ9_9PLEO|nr:unnamed protein product [Periconia digitata]